MIEHHYGKSLPFRVDGKWAVMYLGDGCVDVDGDADTDVDYVRVAEGQGVWESIETALHETAHVRCPYLEEEVVKSLGVALTESLQTLYRLKGWQDPQDPPAF